MLHNAASNIHHTYLRHDACLDACPTGMCDMFDVSDSICSMFCHVHNQCACWLMDYLQERVICTFVVQEALREQAQQLGPVQQPCHFAIFLCDAFAAWSGGH